MDRVAQILLDQDGVIARRQALEAGLTPPAIARLLRRREWTSVHPGVYVEHSGPLTWQQRAWAAVLFSWPAALSHDSALRAGDGAARSWDDSILHVAVERSRRLVEPTGVKLHRVSRFDGRVLWNLGPPRMRYEEAVLDVAGGARSDLAAIARLADACGSRRTTAERLLEALKRRPRFPRRRWLHDVLTDVAQGTCSVLEHGYLTRVERPHGLPRGTRQASHRHAGASVYRDVEYKRQGQIVELDGRLFHTSARDRDEDMDRDLEAAASDGRETLRLSYGQVFDRPCLTASRLGRVLSRRGWHGSAHPCPECG